MRNPRNLHPLKISTYMVYYEHFDHRYVNITAHVHVHHCTCTCTCMHKYTCKIMCTVEPVYNGHCIIKQVTYL